MTNRVRWVKGGNPEASDAAPTQARSPMTWERATKVLTMSADADDTNPVPAVSRRRAIEATGEIDVIEVIEEEPPPRPKTVSISATCEIQADDVLEEVTVPKNRRPSERTDRKTDPPAWRERKTDPPQSRRLVANGAPVPHWTDAAAPVIPPPAPVPSTRPWVVDPRSEATRLHEKPRARAPWLVVGAAAGAALALGALIVLAPATTSAANTTARVPTLHHVDVKHGAEHIGHGPVVPSIAVGSLRN